MLPGYLQTRLLRRSAPLRSALSLSLSPSPLLSLALLQQTNTVELATETGRTRTSANLLAGCLMNSWLPIAGV